MTLVLSLEEAKALPKGELRQAAYCALDTTGTLEVYNNLKGQLDEAQENIYRFEIALSNATLSAMSRGVRVDRDKQKELLRDINRELKLAVKAVDADHLVRDVWDGTAKETGLCPKSSRKDGKHKWPKGVEDSDAAKQCETCGAPRFGRSVFNPNSPDQVAHLLYDILGAPPQKNKLKKISTDEDCLQRIQKKRSDLSPLIDKILLVKDLTKQHGFVDAKLGSDGRYYSTFAVGGTWTGRLSSKKSPIDRLGGNMQNIAARHRVMFIPDPGYKIFYADLMKAESHIVAAMAGDEAYLSAHDPGQDTHTLVSRLVWADALPWTGDIQADKKIAKDNRPPWDDVEGHEYRFQAKRIQHGSNYGLSPLGISMIAKIPLWEARRAQRAYFDAFPHIPAWHDWIRVQVKEQRTIWNPLGRGVRLFGRPWDDHTWRQGLSFPPQSAVADILNLAFYRVWLYGEDKLVQLLAQVHDAILGQFPAAEQERALALLSWAMSIPVDVTDYTGKVRQVTLGTEIAIGQNWGHKSPENPRGIDEKGFEWPGPDKWSHLKLAA